MVKHIFCIRMLLNERGNNEIENPIFELKFFEQSYLSVRSRKKSEIFQGKSVSEFLLEKNMKSYPLF